MILLIIGTVPNIDPHILQVLIHVRMIFGFPVIVGVLGQDNAVGED